MVLIEKHYNAQVGDKIIHDVGQESTISVKIVCYPKRQKRNSSFVEVDVSYLRLILR